jgi:hypothetical protein
MDPQTPKGEVVRNPTRDGFKPVSGNRPAIPGRAV